MALIRSVAIVGLTLLVASIAVVDSLNPSTLVPGVWLASARSTVNRLASYTVGVFAAYLTGGLVLVFGPGRMLISSLHDLRGPLEHSLEASFGILALAFALFLWRSRGRAHDQAPKRRVHTRASAFALGAGIMTVELPTAFMYFGAVSAILAARRAAPVEISLLAVYNAVFVAPLIAFLAIRHLAGDRSGRWMTAAEAHIRRLGHLMLTGVALAGGLALVTIGMDGLLLG